ncbi:MAG: hypothetical protein JZU65_23720, partial [Chlorobium sp.]|nr:hypothetical protein [Chlorobium sp.]
VPALAERKAMEILKGRGIVSEPSTIYKATQSEQILDEIQMMLIKQWSKKGHAAMLREVARLLEEEETAKQG